MEMNGSSQSSASTPAASGPTTPQQVAAAAAALAASRAASVSAAMRSVFGAKQQAALASAMMNASVNAAASKAAAAAVARAVPPAATTTLKPALARPVPTARPAVAAASAATTSAATTSVVVMQSSFDGLPALAPHASSCTVDDATARIASLACHAHDVPRDGAVELYGEPITRAAVRAALVDHYAATNQLAKTPSETNDDDDAGGAISEMTLRMDTELEMLRRQCFAERNARWQYYTPDQFAPAPAAREPVWVAAPNVGPRRQTLLLRKYHEHQRLHASDKAHGLNVSSDPVLADHEALLQSLVGVESVRERAWPPKEFVAKSTTKPSRGGSGASALQNAANRTSSGKKKPVGMVGVVDETPVTARVCAECHTQSSALWRKRPRAPAPASIGGMAPPAGIVLEEDVCLPCYFKTQRRDLFDRKAAEKARRIKEEAARAAAEARALKKQQQQMQKKIKKLQQLQQQTQDENDSLVVKAEDAEGTFADGVDEEEDDEILIRPIKLTRRESLAAASTLSSSYDVAPTMDYESSALAAEDKKKREKKSKKDKKKKKKKKKKKASDDWDDSDSDDDGAASSVIMPSPPQRQMDGFVYADRAADPVSSLESAAYGHHDEGDLTDSISSELPVVEVVKSESKSKKRAASTATTSSRSSKKRKSTDSEAPLAAPPTPTEKGRGSRARSSSSSSSAVPVPAPTTPSARKRARPTKKETARERELRALGQYCPVCNMTYEEDDASPFVCCDSCEMWVHAACDTSLSPETLATLADSNEKYICPLCGGR